MNNQKELDKALKELKAHIKFMKKNDLPHEQKAKEDFKYIQKILENLDED